MTGLNVKGMAVAAVVALCGLEVPSLSAKPNVLVILTDDQGIGDLSFYGNTVLETPHIDRLARESARMEHFYATPVCAPTRAAFLTGRRSVETGVWGVHWGRDYLALDETTIADVLGANGYDTAMIGKWHSGRAPAWMPWNRGFNEAWVASLYKHQNCAFSHNGRLLETNGWAAETMTDIAIDWILRDRGEQPFFLLMSHMAPHGPWEAPDEFIRKYKQKGCSDRLSILFGMLDHMDEQIGRLLDGLTRSGLRGNTLVLFMSDNGPIHTVRVGNAPPLSAEDVKLRNPQNLRGVKGTPWENGCRVPCFVSWPGVIPPGAVPALSDVTDLFPTFLAAAEIPLPQGGLPIHGQSLLPVLTGQSRDWPEPRRIFHPHWEPFWKEGPGRDGVIEDPSLVAYENQIAAMRSGSFKLIKNRNSIPELYDLSADPGETKNIAAQMPEKTEQMARAMSEAFEQMLATGRCFQTPRFHIGHPDYDTYRRIGGNGGCLGGSEIPFCAATRLTGSVATREFGSVGWTGAGDSQTVPVDVVTPGLYEVRLEADRIAAGTRVHLKVGDAVLETSLNSQGRTASLGDIRLEQGSQEVVFRLVALPSGAETAFGELNFISFEKGN